MKWSVDTPRAVTVKRTIERIKGKRGRREIDPDLLLEEEKGLETSHGREPNAQMARGVKVILLAPRNRKN